MTAEPTDTTDRMAAILAPFDGDAPAGVDLRGDVTPQSLYFRLRDARAEARAAERMADNDPAAVTAGPTHWKAVEDLATEALVSHSKDIEIAAWLTESLTRRAGLSGLAEGAMVLAGLIKSFWNSGLLPHDDLEEPEGRLVAVSGLSGQDRDGSLLQPLRKIVLFERIDGAPVTFWEFERVRDSAPPENTGQKQQNTTAPNFAELEATAQSHGRAALLAVGRDVTVALAAWQDLEAAAASVTAGDAMPATSRVRNLLDVVRRTVERYVPATEFNPPEAISNGDMPDREAAADESDPALPGRTARPLGAALRDEMLDDILRIATIFRRNEPNSPLSYTLEEAVRRARLPWPDLLRELLPDPAPRSSILSGLGIRPLPE